MAQEINYVCEKCGAEIKKASDMRRVTPAVSAYIPVIEGGFIWDEGESYAIETEPGNFWYECAACREPIIDAAFSPGDNVTEGK